MVGEKQPKPTLAETRIAFLKNYLTAVQAFQDRLIVDPGVAGELAKGLQDRIDADRPELLRVAQEIGAHMPSPPDRGHKTVQAIKVAIREWERAGEVARDRIETLKAYLAEVRRLATIEAPVDHARTHPVLPAERRAVAELVPQMTALRDQLGEEQHEIERILVDVGRSLDDYSLARGALGLVDFIAGEIAAAVGAYREWPTTRGRRQALATSASAAPRPAALAMPPISIHNDNRNTNTVNVTSTQVVLQHLAQAIEQAAPEDKKAGWLETVKDIGGSLAGAGVKAALEKLLGPGS